MEFSNGRIISDGCQTEIPCLECGERYTAYCVTHLDGDEYELLTCYACGDWDYHDRYIARRLTVMDEVGMERVEWKFCASTNLSYMVVKPAPLSFWDVVTARYMALGDNIQGLIDLLCEIQQTIDGLDMLDIMDVVQMDVETIKREIEMMIDMESGE